MVRDGGDDGGSASESADEWVRNGFCHGSAVRRHLQLCQESDVLEKAVSMIWECLHLEWPAWTAVA